MTHHDEADQQLGGDLLVGADAIRNYLTWLGLKDADIYNLRRHGLWPIGKSANGRSGRLVASKRRLNEHIDALTRRATTTHGIKNRPRRCRTRPGGITQTK